MNEPANLPPNPSTNGTGWRPQWARFHPRLLDTLQGYDRQTFSRDVMAGITVGMVALPLAMAFAVASGVKPEQGIFTAIIGGFLISLLGGSNVQIGGPAGAFIVIVYGIVERYGLTNLLISTALAGGLLFVMGALKLGALVRYMPVTIIIGFTNGIAVVIGLSQLKDLLGLAIAHWPADFFQQTAALASSISTTNPWSVAVGLASLLVVVVWPKPSHMPSVANTALSPQQRLLRLMCHVPGTIIALALGTLLTIFLELPIDTIGSRFGGIPQGLPQLSLPPFSWESAKQLLIPTLTIATLGAVESLICARVADNLTTLPRHDPNQELMAQGLANMVAPMLGCIPATGTVARTVTNVRSGATTPVAGIVHSVTLLLVVVLAAPLAAHVPLAALSGILLFVAWNMGEWREFVRLRQFSHGYRATLLGTFILTVAFDLMVAMEVGLVLACISFIFRMSQLFKVAHEQSPTAGVQVFTLYGALFFGAVSKVEAIAQQIQPGTHSVLLRMQRLVSIDSSGADALEGLYRTLGRRGVALHLCEINDQPRDLLRRAGLEAHLGAGRVHADFSSAWQGMQAKASE